MTCIGIAYVTELRVLQELQRHNALECLSDASNFENTDEPSQFAITQRCVRQLVSVLQRVAQAWKSVLRPSMYTSSIGELVNHVLYIILLDIEDQEDISEEASRRLGELCTMLHELEDLFIVAGEVSRKSCVPWSARLIDAPFIVARSVACPCLVQIQVSIGIARCVNGRHYVSVQ